MSRALFSTLFLTVTILAFAPSAGVADPCLMVYPGDGTIMYHYESAEYYVVGPGDSLYEASYDRAGWVLIDVNTGVIAYEVYQASGLAGFQLDEMHQGYFIMASDFTVTVDGFNGAPTTYVNVLMVFDLVEPEGCDPTITIGGNAVSYDMTLGWYYPIGDFVVSTMQPDSTYSDTQNYAFSWTGCQSIRIWAYSDEDFDLNHDGGECFSAFSHDLTVPTEVHTWGRVKSMYR